MLHAVEHGKNHGLVTDIGTEVFDRAIELIGFHCEEDHVELTRGLARADHFDGNDGLLSAAGYRESTRQLRGAAGADEEGHVSSRSRQAAAKIAADAAGANNQGSHGGPSLRIAARSDAPSEFAVSKSECVLKVIPAPADWRCPQHASQARARARAAPRPRAYHLDKVG